MEDNLQERERERERKTAKGGGWLESMVGLSQGSSCGRGWFDWLIAESGSTMVELHCSL